MERGFGSRRVVCVGLFLVGSAVLFVSSFVSVAPEAEPSARGESKEPSFWLSLEEVEKRMQTEKRKIFVDLYTDWCGPCKLMDAKTFRNKKVVSQLRDNYYAVKFDAESKKTVRFAGKEFKYVADGNYNQFATALTKGQLVFPSLVFLDKELKVFKVVQGYKSARKLSKILEENRQ